MTAYCVDVSGSTEAKHALVATKWIRERLEPGDVVIAFSFGAEVTTLEDIEAVYSGNVADSKKYGGTAWFGGTDLKELFELTAKLRVSSVVVITDGYVSLDGIPPFKAVDITRLPEVHTPKFC